MPHLKLCASLLVAVLIGGCAKEPPQKARKETFPVKGKVLVDGKPAIGVSLQCVSLGAPDKSDPTSSSASIDQDGNLTFSTYELGDGVPEGEYALRFEWFTKTLSNAQPSVDKFKGRYRDEKKSPAKFTVKKGAPVDLGEIELSTK